MAISNLGLVPIAITYSFDAEETVEQYFFCRLLLSAVQLGLAMAINDIASYGE